jgi:DNA-binding transcriptional ArsR family regulator
MLYLISKEPHSAKELAEETGLYYLTVINHLRPLYQRKLIHIAGWEQDSQNRFSIRLFKFGPGKDAVPPRLSKPEKDKKRRDRKRLAKLLNLTRESAQNLTLNLN